MAKETNTPLHLRPRRTKLTMGLNRAFQHRKLNPDEVQSIRQMADAYQQKQKVRWSENEFSLYHQYFGFLTALKAKSMVEEIQNFGYFKSISSLEILDIGAGTLGASLGLVDGLQEAGIEVTKVMGIDPQESAFRWAKKNFKDFLPKKTDHDLRLPKRLDDENRIVVFGNVLTELDPLDESHPVLSWLEDQFKVASGKNLFLFVEPADFEFNQKFLKLRDRWREKIRILLPCTHAKTCPALVQKEWCHEERHYEAEPEYWNMIRDLGYRQKHLQFSGLLLGKRPSIFQTEHARVVSSDVSGKGQSERWVCTDGKRYKTSLLLRDKNEKNEAFHESLRGDVMDLKILDDARQPK